MRLIWKLVTSYPMTVIEHRYFRDSVSGKDVKLCKDRHGRYFMAESRWSLFRVAI